MLEGFASLNLLFALILYVETRPSLSTPLFEFPLLAILHSIVLGTLLPLLLDRFYTDGRAFRIGAYFVLVGEAVIVVGFVIHPRSPLPSQGGLMVATGLLLIVYLLRSKEWQWVYWIFLAGSSVMGVMLGTVLFRPYIDPIPFSMIAVHGLLGMALGLFPLFWIGGKGRGVGHPFRVILVLTILALMVFILRQTLITPAIWPLVTLMALLSGAGISSWGKVLGLLCVTITAIMASAGELLPGEWISLLGVLLMGGCAVGYFRTKAYSPSDLTPD